MNSYNFKKNSIFIIANPNFYYMKDYLINDLNIVDENIFLFDAVQVCDRMPQYLCESFIKIEDDEIFVDCGAADFDTTIEFLNYVNWCYQKIYVIEPLKEFYNICVNKVNEFNLKKCCC